MEEEKYWDTDWRFIIPIIIGIVILFLWLVVFFAIQNTITGFINPEYWALKRIFELIK